MIVVLRFRSGEDQPGFPDDFAAQARGVLAALADRPGFRRGAVGRAVDDETLWLIESEWETVGSYRRALGAFDVRMTLTPLARWVLDEPSAFESLVTVTAGGVEQVRPSDRAAEPGAAPGTGPGVG